MSKVDRRKVEVRDLFAMAALIGHMAKHGNLPDATPDRVAIACYSFADAMIAARHSGNDHTCLKAGSTPRRQKKGTHAKT